MLEQTEEEQIRKPYIFHWWLRLRSFTGSSLYLQVFHKELPRVTSTQKPEATENKWDVLLASSVSITLLQAAELWLKNFNAAGFT